MRKITLLGTLLMCSVLATANTKTTKATVGGSFQTLESQYNALMKKEADYYATKKKAAEAAQAKLNEQTALYADVESKIQQLDQVKNIRFYKGEYNALISKFSAVKNQLNAEMAAQTKIVNDFLKLQQIKEGK